MAEYRRRARCPDCEGRDRSGPDQAQAEAPEGRRDHRGRPGVPVRRVPASASTAIAGSAVPATPTKVTVADVLAGNVGVDRYVSLDAEPLMSHAIRATAAKGNLGYRVTPARGTGDRLWLVLPGDGWEQPSTGAYIGRLRKLSDLPFAKAVGELRHRAPAPGVRLRVGDARRRSARQGHRRSPARRSTSPTPIRSRSTSSSPARRRSSRRSPGRPKITTRRWTPRRGPSSSPSSA